MHSFHYHHGRLHCEDVELGSVAEKIGTPLYVYSAGTIVDHYQRLDGAMAGVDHLICYAVKANSSRAILQLLARAGAGFDIVSAGELGRVISAGGEPSKCTFAGVGKSAEEIEYGLARGVFSLNVESEAELEQISRVAAAMRVAAPIALRINPDVEAHTHQYISTGRSENKFGISLDRAADIYEAASRLPNIRIRGVQMHIGSQITEVEPFAGAVSKVMPLVDELKSRYAIEYFSIGGGLGIVYESSLASGEPEWWRHAAEREHQLKVADYASAILPLVRSAGVRVFLEPGRFVVGNAGVLLTRVRYIKETERKRFAIVDAGMNDLIRPALYQAYHEIVPVREPSSPETHAVDIVGPVCESGDFFAQDRSMPRLEQGDLLSIMSAGAYGFAMASNYNSRPLPAEVLVSGNQAALIRDRQTLADLVRGEHDLPF